MYKAYTQYIGFRTGQVINVYGGGQLLWIDNGGFWNIVSINNSGSRLVGEVRK